MNDQINTNQDLYSYLFYPKVVKFIFEKLKFGSSFDLSENLFSSEDSIEEIDSNNISSKHYDNNENEKYKQKGKYTSVNEESYKECMNINIDQKLVPCVIRIEPSCLSYKNSLEHYILVYSFITNKKNDSYFEEENDESIPNFNQLKIKKEYKIDLFQVKTCFYYHKTRIVEIAIEDNSQQERSENICFYVDNHIVANKIKDCVLFLSHYVKLKSILYKLNKEEERN